MPEKSAVSGLVQSISTRPPRSPSSASVCRAAGHGTASRITSAPAIASLGGDRLRSRGTLFEQLQHLFALGLARAKRDAMAGLRPARSQSRAHAAGAENGDFH